MGERNGISREINILTPISAFDSIYFVTIRVSYNAAALNAAITALRTSGISANKTRTINNATMMTLEIILLFIK